MRSLRVPFGAVVLFGLLVAANAAWALPDPFTLLMATPRDTALIARGMNAPCKNADVAAALDWLERDDKLAASAEREVQEQLTNDYRDLQRVQESYERYKDTGLATDPKAHDEHVAEMHKRIDQTARDLESVKTRRRADEDDMYALDRKPACMVPPQTPPPPPPPSGPPSQPPPLHPVSPTHRSTNCVPCRGLADRLNEAADKYAQARNMHDPDQATFLNEMRQLSSELDRCERKCAVRRHGYSEDDPRYMENYTPPAREIRHDEVPRPPRPHTGPYLPDVPPDEKPENRTLPGVPPFGPPDRGPPQDSSSPPHGN